MATKKKKNVKKAAKKLIKKSTKKVVKKATKKTIKASVEKTIKKVTKKLSAKTQAVKSTKVAAKLAVDYSKAITPLGDRLVVRPVGSERMTAGGLIIPDSAAMAAGYMKAKVLAVGQGGKNKKGHLKPLDVKVGDTVLFSEYAGTKVTFNSEDLQIIHETDVMGIVEN